MPGGAVRAHWRPLIETLEALGAEERALRWDGIRRQLRENGVTYNVYDDPRGVEPAVDPRPGPARHRRRRVADDRGGSRAARDAPESDPRRPLRPAAPAARRRAAAGAALRESRVSAALSRRRGAARAAPRALRRRPRRARPTAPGSSSADRTQAPSGAGYALENRIVLASALPEAFAPAARRPPGAVLRARFATRSRRSRRAAATSRASCCSRRARTTRPTSSTPTSRATSATGSSKAPT